ncbi:MAG TPA: M28 family peptidase [Candidatus Deferrimicrobium sp.]|nr:M28 family peptidase [Candidatus Deferrimicrobium sp.]
MAPINDSFSMIDFIKEICEEIGPRLGTYEQEKKAGLKIEEFLAKNVDETVLEDFTCHPAAFLDFTKVAWLVIIVGTCIFWWIPIVSAILYIYALTIYVFEQMYLKEYVDFLFPKRRGTNVIGKQKPSGHSKQIVICSAHHDSAYEFPLFEKYRAKFGLLAYFTAATIILSALMAITNFILDYFGNSPLISNILLLILPILCIIMTGYLNFRLHSNFVIPGAQDNLSGVAVVIALAQHFATKRLKNIELWFISFSCEECMRGSKRFVEKHRAELNASKTINYDMVGKGEICIISKEPYFTAKHSFELAKDFQKSNTHIPIKVAHFGGTDAANFSKKGLEAISIVGLTPHGYPETWHTLKDTPQIIEHEKLDKTLQASIKFLSDLDNTL